MKKFFFFAAALVAGIGAMAQQTTDQVVKLSSDKYDFGKIKQGVPVTTYFTITNISDKPVVIESATAGCGCTTPEYSKEPIPAGGTSKLKVGYNAANMGPFTKPVTVKLAGVSDTKQVIITGEVVDAASIDATAKAETAKPALAAAPVVATDVKTKTKIKTVKKASK
jgi:hypothetical protein